MTDNDDAPPQSPLPFLEAIRNRGHAPPSASKPPYQNPAAGNTTPVPTPKMSSTAAIKTPTAAIKTPTVVSQKQQSDRSPALKTPTPKKTAPPAPVLLPQPPPAAPAAPPLSQPPVAPHLTPENKAPVNDSACGASEKGLKMHKSGKFKVIIDLPQIEQAFQKITCKYN